MSFELLKYGVEVLHIKLRQSRVYHHCESSYLYTLGVMIYSPDGLMRYNDSNAIVDDIPLLSQWIKK